MDNSAGQKKFATIKDYILSQVETAAWPEHSRIPSENELATQFGVSRMTARRALQELTEQGVLYRTQGLAVLSRHPSRNPLCWKFAISPMKFSAVVIFIKQN